MIALLDVSVVLLEEIILAFEVQAHFFGALSRISALTNH
jgi:hypothetical protein